jgi:hypothetical protein
LGIFPTQIHMHVDLKFGTCSFNNKNFNTLIPWDSQNPYDPRLNKKQAHWRSSKKKKKQLSAL